MHFVSLDESLDILAFVMDKFCQGVLLLLVSTLLKMVSVDTDSHQIQNTNEFGQVQ